jgi:glucose/arabinose dehydrogenase
MKSLRVVLPWVCVFAAVEAKEEEAVTSSITGNIHRPAQVEATPERLAKLKIAKGFSIAVFARGLEAPRMMAPTPEGRLYVTRRGEKGGVMMLEDKEGDGSAGEAVEVLKLPHVHGIAIKEGRVYLSTVREIYSAPIEKDGRFGKLQKLYDDLPDAGQHPNRTLGFNPQGKLFLSVGSTCNAAPEPNPESATLLGIATDGSGRKIFASGLRNTIGFDWHPKTGKLYGMDHGIDWLGDDSQREELNELKEDKKYGWPFVFEEGKANLADNPKETTGMTWEEYAESCEPSVLSTTAHSAPMALLFPSGKSFPADFAGDALVTLHGSWNRGTPSGYSVVRLRFKDGKPQEFEDFATGFCDGKEQFGRPCGLVEWKDGSILMSDDGGGLIYRISNSAKEDENKVLQPLPAGAEKS